MQGFPIGPQPGPPDSDDRSGTQAPPVRSRNPSRRAGAGVERISVSMAETAPDIPGRVRPFALLASACVALGLAGCVAAAPRPRAGDEPPSPDDPAATIAALVESHNLERTTSGRRPLAVNEALTAAAQAHADDMAARRRMSHRGSDGSSPFRRMGRAGYRYERAGENVAAGQRSVAEVMRAWMNSPGHRRNVLGKFTEIGAGRATDERGTPYWCVTFGTPAPRD